MRRTTGGTVRILFVIDQLGIGGTERQLVETMRCLDRGKFTPFLACLAGEESRLELLSQDMNVHTVLLNVKSTYSLSALTGIFRLIRFIRAESIHVVQCYFPKAKVIGCIAGKLAGAMTVSCMRDLGFNLNWNNWLPTKLANACTDRFQANSLGVKNYLVGEQWIPTGRIDVVLNGVDLEKYRPPTSVERVESKIELGLDPSVIVIGAVANLKPIKALGDLISAASGICRGYERLHLVLIGQGPQEDELKRQATALGIGSKVTFITGCKEVLPYLWAFDVGVLCSLSEGFSNSILEYMAVGLPVVATSVGGNQEQVCDGVTGFLVPPGDNEALAKALVKLVEGERLRRRMGEQVHQKCVARYGLTGMIAQMEEGYLRLVSTRNCDLNPSQS